MKNAIFRRKRRHGNNSLWSNSTGLQKVMECIFLTKKRIFRKIEKGRNPRNPLKHCETLFSSKNAFFREISAGRHARNPVSHCGNATRDQNRIFTKNPESLRKLNVFFEKNQHFYFPKIQDFRKVTVFIKTLDYQQFFQKVI